MAANVPVIDLAAAAGRDTPASVLDLVRDATETVGVVQLVNHGVPVDLITEFARWAGPQSDHPVLRDLALRYLAAGQSLAERVLGLYARAHGLPDGTFPVDPLPYLSLTVNDYPVWRYPDTGGAADQQRPLAAAGSSVLTVIAQAGDGGALQVQLPDRTWAAVPAVPGALQVFSGSLLARWTNGRLRPARHRMLAVPAATQRSAAVFSYPALAPAFAPLAPFSQPAEVAPGYRVVRVYDPGHQASSSARVGAVAGPGRVTAKAAAAFARAAAASGDSPSARAARNTPACASPAPVVSTAVTTGAGTWTGPAAAGRAR